MQGTKLIRAGRRRSRVTGMAGISALAVAGMLLAGCAGSSPEGEGGTVTVWSFETGDAQTALEEAFVPLFEAENPGAKVEFVFVPLDQFKTKVVAAAGAGSGPDVIIGAMRDFPTMHGAGAIADISSQWDAFDGNAEFLDQFVLNLDNKIYGVRTKGETVALWYNKDILDEVGVDVPTTRDDLDNAFKAAHDAGYTAFGICGQPTGGCEYEALPWLSSEGFDYANPDEGALAAGFSVIEDWAKAGYIPRDAVTYDQSIPFQEFMAGQMAFVQTGNWNITTAKSDATFDFGIMPIPGGAHESSSYLGGEVAFVGAFAKDPELAWSFVESTFLSREGQMSVFESTGSVPARLDAANDPIVADDPYLAPFLEQLAKASPNPPLGVDPLKAPAAQLIVGQYWSSVIGQQMSADQAASEAIAGVKTALK